VWRAAAAAAMPLQSLQQSLAAAPASFDLTRSLKLATKKKFNADISCTRQ